MIVVTLGLPGSASTLAFNIAREVLQACTGRPCLTIEASSLVALEEGLADATPGDLLIRTHNLAPSLLALLEAGGARAVLTSRDPRDCVASLESRFERNTPLWCTTLSRSIATFETVRARWGAPVLAYERTVGSLLPMVTAVAQALGLSLPADARDRIAARWTREAVARRVTTAATRGAVTESGLRQDPETLFNERHLGDGRIGKWGDVLQEPDRTQVEDAFSGLGDLAQPAVPGRRLRFAEPCFGTASRAPGTPNLDPASSIGLRLLCLCFLHAGQWRITIEGSLPASHLPGRLQLVVGGRILLAEELPAPPPGAERLALPPGLSVALDHRNHEHNIELVLDGPPTSLPDPHRPDGLALEAVLEAP